MTRLFAALAFLFVTVSACAQPAPTISGETGRALDQYLTESVSPDFSGVVLAVKEGQVVLRKGYGLADRSTGTPNTPSTVFQIGSVTKPLTAIAAMSLVDQGLIDPSDSISEYFDAVPDDKRSITLHHLLTHTAGFPGGLGPDYQTVSREAYIRLAMETGLDRAPGEAYEYSNVGFALLAAIIEQVTGESFDTYLQRLFGNAGITNTGYRLAEGTFARGYDGENDLGLPFERNWAADGPYWHLRGNGGLLSTAEDLCAVHLALEAGDLISRASVDAMHTRHTDEGPGSGSHYGYGWALFTTPRGTSLAAHNGGDPGFTADFLRFRDEDAVLIVLSNDRQVDATRLSRPLESILFGGNPPPFRRAERQALTPAGLADAPGGRRALALIETINAASEEASREFVLEHADAGFRQDEDRMVRFFEAVRDEMGGAPFTLERAEWDPEDRTLVLYTTLPDGRGYRAEVGIQPGEDELIEGLFTDYDTSESESTAAANDFSDTPAGRTVASLFEAIEGDDDALRQFIETGLSQQLRDAYPENEHLSLMKRLQGDLADAEITTIDAQGPTTLAVGVRQAGGFTVAFLFTVESDPPHGLVGITAEGE